MKHSALLILLYLGAAAGVFAAESAEHRFAVVHGHTLRDCRGTLVIGPTGIRYEAGRESDTRAWNWTDIRELRVESPRELSLVTYEDQKRLLGRDRVFHFRLIDGDITPALAQELAAWAARPPVLAVLPPESLPPLFQIPVKHRHLTGGCVGELRVYAEHLEFRSAELPTHNRFWRWSDLAAFSQPERFLWLIHTFAAGEDTLTFDLRQDAPVGAADNLRDRLVEAALPAVVGD